MLFIIRITSLILLSSICFIFRIFASTPPRSSRNEVNRILATGVRVLNFDTDDENDRNQPASTQLRGPFSDDEDEGRGTSNAGTSSEISSKTSSHRRLNRYRFSESESDEDEASIGRTHLSETSGLGSDSPSIDQSDSDRSRLYLDPSREGEDGGTLVGLESPIGLKMSGGTPSLEFNADPSAMYNRYDWKLFRNEPRKIFSLTPERRYSPNRNDVPESPSYGSASISDFISPPRNGPLGSGPVGSLNELYQSPVGSFHLNRDLWSPDDRRYIKSAKPPPAPGNRPVDIVSKTSRIIPNDFLLAVEFGRKHNNKALSNMKWAKTFISGNSAIVYGIELNGENLILKISKHGQSDGSLHEENAPCVYEDDIRSLHDSHDPCVHKPKHGLVSKPACSADLNLVPFEYYIAEKVALTRGSMPAAASIRDTFAKDEKQWYLIFEELPGISPLVYGENILERLAKPLIRQQLEALEKLAQCHIMHLDAHWGNVLYSRERGIQLIDFGLATLVDRFELPDPKAALVITFTFNRCLDCEASKFGRDFLQLTRKAYPIDGYLLLSHPWLQY